MSPIQPPPSPSARRGSTITAKTPVRDLLDRYGIVPRKRFGQHFLHEAAVGERIVAAARVSPGDRVLEVGPGLGALTIPLLDAGARVVAVEVDRRIVAYLRDELGDRDGFTLVEADVLSLDPAELVREPVTLVSNLPYSITGPVLSLLIGRADSFPRAVLMTQKEVAARLVAGAGGKEIGAPAVLIRLLYRVQRLFDVGKGAFLPPPEIVSSVLALERITDSRLDPLLADAVNLAYRQRRKMLRKTLKGIVADEGALAAALESIGQPDTARPEDLEPEEWPDLLRAAGAKSP
jgi:16S rRNA (adenine1518-N6/adenine1519-N6)-dimethyltransferase